MPMATPVTVTYVGHSTILLEIDGLRLLTDPVLTDRVAFLRRAGHPIPPSAYQDLDAILISHLHYDHLHFPSLHKIGDLPRLIVPDGAGALLQKHGYKQFEEIGIGETRQIGGVAVRAVPADHVRSRRPMGPEADCLGFVLEGGVKIYYPGDTRLFPEMAKVGDGLDLALMPVWGWGPDRGKMHMSPKQAADALTLLRPRMAIPIHWGTFVPIGMAWLRPGFQYFPPLIFATHAKKVAPQVEVKILLPGESVQLGA